MINEIIEALASMGEGEIQAIMQAAMDEYQERYPDWRMMFLSAHKYASDEQSAKMRHVMDIVEEKMAKKFLAK